MAKQKVETEEAAPERIGRFDAACRVVKDWQEASDAGTETTLQDLVREVEKLVVAGGMKPNAEATEAELWGILTPLDGLGQVKIVYQIRKL